MRAVQFDRYGDVEVLEVREVPDPVPGPGEVLLEVKAAGINPGEAAIRRGAMADQSPSRFPSGQGSDLAGVVRELGPGVAELAVGDEVLGWSWTRSSQAELAVVPSAQLTPKPAGLGWDQAGALYVVGATAWAAAAAVGAGPGDTVAVSAAAGGVGSVLVQLLVRRGAAVIGIASEANHGWLRRYGVVPVAYGDGLADRVRAAAPEGVDAFVDLFGPDYVRLAVELGVARDRIDTIISFQAAREYGVKTEGSTQATSREVMAELAGMVASGELDLPVAATYPMEEVRQAFRHLERRHTRGKIVLRP